MSAGIQEDPFRRNIHHPDFSLPHPADIPLLRHSLAEVLFFDTPQMRCTDMAQATYEAQTAFDIRLYNIGLPPLARCLNSSECLPASTVHLGFANNLTMHDLRSKRSAHGEADHDHLHSHALPAPTKVLRTMTLPYHE